MKCDPELSWKAKDLMEQQEREEEVRKRIENHNAVLREDGFLADEVCRAGIETSLDAYCGLVGSGATISYIRRLADHLEERNPEQTLLPFN